MTVVYFVQAGGPGGSIKIGIARNMRERMSSLQTGCPDMLAVLATMPGGAGEERFLHDVLSAHRIRGEWFRPAPAVLSAVELARAGQLPQRREPASAPTFSHLRNLVALVRCHLKCRGVSLVGFADACGLHRNTLLGVDSPEWNPTLATLLAMEAELHRRQSSQVEAATPKLARVG